MRFEVPGRIGPAGELEPLDEAEIERVVAEVAEAEPESVAICLLFSYLDPSHEERLAAALREAIPGTARLDLERGAAAISRVRALLDHGDRRLPLPASRPLSDGARRRSRRGRAAGAAGDAVLRRRRPGRRGRPRRRLERPLGPRRRRGRGRPAGEDLGRGQRARLRHGRHLLRRLRDRRGPGPPHRCPPARRPGDPAADGRCPHGRGRRWVDRLARPRRRPAGRPPLGRRRPRAGLLREGRRSADGDRRKPQPSATWPPTRGWPATSLSTPAPRRRRSRSSARRSASRRSSAPRASSGSQTRR